MAIVNRDALDDVKKQILLKKMNIFGPGAEESKIDEDKMNVLKRTSKMQQKQLARSAAAIVIQSAFRGYACRKRYFSLISMMLSTLKHGRGELEVFESPDVRDLRVQNDLRAKYDKYCGYFDKRGKILPYFADFCAAFIQAHWKTYIVTRAYRKYVTSKRLKEEEASTKDLITQPVSLKQELKEFMATAHIVPQHRELQEEAAKKIQNIWKNYYNSRIYKYYRDLIKMRESGDPYETLKYINPKEANLMDRNLGFHIRFRLAGTSFPPLICYKIFIHKNLVDMNSFSPRNYVAEENKQLLPKIKFLKRNGPLPEKRKEDEWYLRREDNNWRPVIDVALFISFVDENSSAGIKFHHSKLVRHKDIVLRRKNRKLQWMRKLYAMGNEQKTEAFDIKKVKSKDIDKELENIIRELEGSNSLINWTQALDFDSYHFGWLNMATTVESDYHIEHHPAIKEMSIQDEIVSNKAELNLEPSDLPNLPELEDPLFISEKDSLMT